ncbi:AAA family ATPase [Aeromonas hydrophila]|uniref:AAA family ATPase n=1 Tax=Aeromonas hydrophila TaxID=644 RepID=UPI000AAEFD44|nr:AAA family ATPase [Aeromonas hydrophila]MDM5118707.1 ATP-binding protein [Aeromonas hydrophila]PNO61465.1 hypothetical protein MC69_005290 [Aeromonas hydrophila]
MAYLSEIDIYNIIRSNKLDNIKFDKQVSILTGYNGSGKTTILKSIHETITTYNNIVFPHARKGWAIELLFKNSFKIRNYILPFRSSNMDFIDHNYLSKHANIDDKMNICYEMFMSQILKHENAEKRNKENIKLPDNQGMTSSFNGFLQYKNDLKPLEDINSILFCDELFYFNGEEGMKSKVKLEELDIYSRNNNLSKTLYILLHEFSKQSILNEKERKTKDTISELRLMINSVQYDVKETLLEKINELEASSGYQIELENFMSDVNFFFNLTRRKAFIDDDGLISLNFNENIIKWYDLSKGEKTLLSLLLVAYLNKNNDTIFLLDEPDLSLHIKWQKVLIEKLATIAPRSQFIICTHSPALIGTFQDQKIINISGMMRG